MSFLSKLFRRLTGRPERRYTVKLRGRGWPEAPVYKPSPDTLSNVSTTKGTVDLRPQDGPIYDQGQLGSCTANGWAGLLMFICIKLFKDPFVGSRLMLYYL